MTLTRTLTGVSCAVILSTAPVVMTHDAAFAAAPSNGCPAGYQLLDVLTLTQLGYQVPALVNSPDSGVLSFGHPGNGDPYVCGVRLGNQTGPYGPIYNFLDNQLPVP